MLLYWIIKSLSIPSADKYSKKHLKVCEADTLKQVDANVREEENKNRSSLYYSDKLEAQLRKASKEKELAKTKKEKREKEAQERKARLDSLLDSNNYCLDSSLDINPKNNLEDEKATTAKDLLTTVYSANKQTRMRDSLSARNKRTIKLLARAYILYFKELLSNNSRIFASVIGITRTQAIVLLAIIRHNEVVAIDSANSILCDLSDLLVVRFCIFSNSALENISILTNKEVVEMQTNTTTALANKLAAINKLVRLQTFTLKILEHVETFALVCSFRKVDRYVFRANNTISGQTIFDKFYNCKLESIIIAKFYKDLRKYN
ncbi:hypothetical protein HBH89_246910 [Parastagonospora nodorum]|nr:hypothetical protein HBH89_246910 [Parastagonospora nodorum]